VTEYPTAEEQEASRKRLGQWLTDFMDGKIQMPVDDEPVDSADLNPFK